MDTKPIGQVAKQFKIDSARLRDWCNKGLIEAEKRSNTRYIPESEFKKIEVIRDFFDTAKKAGTRATFLDAKEELKKLELFRDDEEHQQKKELATIAKNAMQQVLNDEEMTKALQFLAEEVIKTKQETINAIEKIQELHNEQLEKQLEDSQKEREEVKGELKAIQEQLQQIQEAASGSVLETIEPEPIIEKPKGFFKRLFGS